MIRFSVLAATLVALLVGVAGAQTCGDADGNGSVTVTDGVQTLRSAADLSSTCTPARCDVDGNGSVSVTDGVNVLRKAAELSAPNACPGSTGEGVSEAVDSVVPFFAFGFAFAADITSLTGSAAEPAADGDDACPDGGTRGKRFISAGILRIQFDACRYSSPGLGRFEFGQGLTVNFLRSQVSLSVLVTDLDSGRVVEFVGFFDFVPRDGGGFIGNGQGIVITTPQGGFTLDLNALTVDAEGHVLSGGGSIADTDDNFALQRIDFEVTGPVTGEIVATFDDNSTSRFNLDLQTGDLTPE